MSNELLVMIWPIIGIAKRFHDERGFGNQIIPKRRTVFRNRLNWHSKHSDINCAQSFALNGGIPRVIVIIHRYYGRVALLRNDSFQTIRCNRSPTIFLTLQLHVTCRVTDTNRPTHQPCTAADTNLTACSQSDTIES